MPSKHLTNTADNGTDHISVTLHAGIKLKPSGKYPKGKLPNEGIYFGIYQF